MSGRLTTELERAAGTLTEAGQAIKQSVADTVSANACHIEDAGAAFRRETERAGEVASASAQQATQASRYAAEGLREAITALAKQMASTIDSARDEADRSTRETQARMEEAGSEAVEATRAVANSLKSALAGMQDGLARSIKEIEVEFERRKTDLGKATAEAGIQAGAVLQQAVSETGERLRQFSDRLDQSMGRLDQTTSRLGSTLSEVEQRLGTHARALRFDLLCRGNESCACPDRRSHRRRDKSHHRHDTEPNPFVDRGARGSDLGFTERDRRLRACRHLV